MEKSEPTWKTKLKKWGMVVLVIVLFFWAFSTARNAVGTAEQNSEKLDNPTYDLTFVPGGPERFEDMYKEVDYSGTENKITKENFKWATIILRNTSPAKATNIDMTLKTTETPAHMLIKAPGYGNEITVESGHKMNTKNITLESINPYKNTYFFLAFNPDNLPSMMTGENVNNWVQNYEHTFSSLHISGADESVSLYGKGFTSLQ